MVNNIQNLNPAAAGNAGLAPVKTAKPGKTTAGALSFNAVLEANLAKDQGLKFSAHAQERLASRQIQLSAQDLTRLEGGVSRAAQKGSRESLVMKDGLAFVVSVTNRTVITAMDLASSKDSVFTNIDSAVIV
jgi:flagellar operon protein